MEDVKFPIDFLFQGQLGLVKDLINSGFEGKLRFLNLIAQIPGLCLDHGIPIRIV